MNLASTGTFDLQTLHFSRSCRQAVLSMCFECYCLTTAVGAVLGLAAVLATRAKRLTSALAHICVGIGGAVSVAWFVSPLGVNAVSGRPSTPQLVGAVFGAVLSLAFYKALGPD